MKEQKIRKDYRRVFITVIVLLVFICLCEATKASEYTGLIVDAHGLDVWPGMSPKIIDTSGREIYGTMNIDPDYVIEKGIVSYVDSIAEAIEQGLVGSDPLIVRAAARGHDPAKTNIIINKEDGDRILKENTRSGFLESLKVAIIR
ncbi:MAG: hypothetical protein NT030_01300 [Candidatus Saganbacteria bacterium]|nr:hypothetical protein [Candidatus Saganbacteria bacterium]